MLIFEALKKDHEKVKNLLNKLVEMKEGDAGRKALIDEVRDELIPHARAEEAIFYNSLRTIKETKDLVMHGYKEHMEAETLLRTLQLKEKIDADWTKTANKLREAILHHIESEEGEIFSAARRVFTQEEAEMMADAFEELKPKVRKEGFLKTTMDLILNMLPPRFAGPLRTMGLTP